MRAFLSSRRRSGSSSYSLTSPAGGAEGAGIAVDVELGALEEGSGSPVRATFALGIGTGRMFKAPLVFMR